jgi:acetyltransferase-like isoleucine patch superfamily enzyme
MLRDLTRCLLGGVVRRYREISDARTLKARYPQAEFEFGATVEGACEFGVGVKIWRGTQVFESSIGRYTYVANYSEIGRARIGAFCSIGPHVVTSPGRHPTRGSVSTYPSFYSPGNAGQAPFRNVSDFQEYLPVEIGNDVLISARVLVLGGNRIGDGAIVGAGAVVTHDVAPYAVVAGVPARVVRHRFPDEDIAFLLKLRWWDRDIAWIKSHAHLFSSVDLLRQAVRQEEAS